MKNKQVIVIGSGLAGSCMARLFADDGYKVEVYEIKSHIAGNIYDCYDQNGILIHQYGPHIFHTNNQVVWDFVNRFSTFDNYINQVLVHVDHQFVQLPINFNSIKQLFPNEFEQFKQEVLTYFNLNSSVSILELKQKVKSPIANKIIDYIFEHVYKNYTLKMWGLTCEQLDPNLFSRVKINLDDVWNYFVNDKYQALPKLGYSKLIQNMLDHENINLILNTDGLKYLKLYDNHFTFKDKECILVYTGLLDALFNYQFGRLDYRSLNLIFETYHQDSYQQTAVVNYPDDPIITRITEYKKLTNQIKPNITTISKEIPGAYDPLSKDFKDPFYPINDKANNLKKQQYLDLASKYDNLILVGRLAQYRYYDMDDVVEYCLNRYQEFMKNNKF